MTRPIIKVELEPIDKVLEVLGMVGLVLMISLPLIYIGSLPDSIPTHYGPDGQPDGFSSKNSIWTLPIIGFVMYAGMSWLNRYPHKFNYVHEITEQNAEGNYKVATKMIRALNVLIVYIFGYIACASIQTALGNQNGLGTWFTPLFYTLIIGIIGFYIFRMFVENGKG